MDKVVLLILIALIQYLWFGIKVGGARGKYGVKAPAVSGNETWERIFRVQQNTLEQLIIFIPALYIFAFYVSAKWALLPGALYLIGRQLYGMTYAKDASKRSFGMILTLAGNAILLIGGVYGVVKNLL